MAALLTKTEGDASSFIHPSLLPSSDYVFGLSPLVPGSIKQGGSEQLWRASPGRVGLWGKEEQTRDSWKEQECTRPQSGTGHMEHKGLQRGWSRGKREIRRGWGGGQGPDGVAGPLGLVTTHLDAPGAASAYLHCPGIIFTALTFTFRNVPLWMIDLFFEMLEMEKHRSIYHWGYYIGQAQNGTLCPDRDSQF